MIMFKLDGLAFETADPIHLNDWHEKLNGTLRNIADDRLAIWTHIVRRPITDYPEGEFRSAFAADLDAKYRARAGDDADVDYGRLRTDLDRRGCLIGGSDMLIAAHALALDATLVTDNVREFKKVAGLGIENWLRPE